MVTREMKLRQAKRRKAATIRATAAEVASIVLTITTAYLLCSVLFSL